MVSLKTRIWTSTLFLEAEAAAEVAHAVSSEKVLDNYSADRMDWSFVVRRSLDLINGSSSSDQKSPWTMARVHREFP